MLSDKAFLVTSTSNERFILKLKGDVASAQRENELLNFVETVQLKVQTPLKSKSGDLIITHDNKNFTLYNFIEGEVHSANHYLEKPDGAKQLGEAIAYLHRALKSVDFTDQFNHKNLYKTVSEFAVKEVLKVDTDIRLQSRLGTLNNEFEHNLERLPRQLIHRDAHIFNFVFQGNNLAGIIDFEIAEVNSRLFDVCYCSTSLLNEIFYDIDQRENWFDFVARLFSSYNKVNQLTADEEESICHVMLSIQLIFMAFFSNDISLYKRNKEMLIWLDTNRERFDKIIDRS